MSLWMMARLGLRFSVPRHYVAVVRGVSIASVSFLLTATALVLLSSASIVQHQQGVEDARTPHEPVSLEPARSYLRVGVFVNDWDGATVTRVVIHRGGHFPGLHPPGIPRNPRPGEAFVSPEFAKRATHSEVFAQSLAGLRIVGQIAPDGLRSQNELRVITGVVGADTERSVMTQTTSFGTRAAPLVDLTGPLAIFLPIVILLTLLPLGIALVLAARLLAPETNKRFALLRALGVTLWSQRIIAATELLPATALGVFVGWLTFRFGWCRVSHVPGTSFNFWPDDSRISGAAQTLVPATCLLATLIIAGATVVAGSTPSTRQAFRSRRPRAWWGAPVWLGLATLASATLAVSPESTTAKGLCVVAIGLFIVGLPPAASVLADRVSVRLALHAATDWGLIGGRWSGQRQGASFRLALAMAVALLAVGATVPYIHSLNGDTGPGEAGLAAAVGYNVDVTNTNLSGGEIDRLPGVRARMTYGTARDSLGQPMTVLSATCSDLRALVRVQGCTGGVQWLSIRKESLTGYVSNFRAPLRVSGLTSKFRQLPKSVVYAPLGEAFHAALLIPPDAGTGQLRAEGFIVNLADGASSLKRFQGALSSVAPTARYGNDYSQLIAQSNAFSGYLQFLRLGLLAALMGLGIALAAAGLRSVDERHHRSRVLRTIGATGSTILRAQFLSQALPVLLSTTFAALLCAAVWGCLGFIDATAKLGVAAYAWLLISPFFLAAAVTLVVLPGSRPTHGQGSSAGRDTG